MTTLAEIREKVRERSDQQNSQFITDAELNGYINNSYAELYDILVSSFEDYYTSIYPFVIASGSSDIAIPSDCYKIRGVDLSYDGTNWVNVAKFNFAERNRIGARTRINVGLLGVNYRLMGDKLYFIPEDRAPGQYRLWYIPRYTPLVNDTDVLSDVLDFDEYIIVDAAIKCLIKEESDPSMLVMAKQALKQRIDSMAANRDAAQPERVGDVSTVANRYGGTTPYYGWY